MTVVPAVVATRQASSRLVVPRIGWIGIALIGGFVALALAAPFLAPYRVGALSGRPLEPPSLAHLSGTNSVGQDLFTQLLSGVRAAVFIAVVAGSGAALLGGCLGVLAGWWGGLVDLVVMRAADVLLVIPRLPLLIVVVAYAGPGLGTRAAIIALTFWPEAAKVLRAQVRSLRYRAHLTATRGFGSGSLHALRRHVVPEVGLVLVAALVAAAGRAVMLEVGLAFLGLGDPNRASWGSIVRDALRFQGLFFTRAWAWWLLPPLLATALLLAGITFVGLAAEQWVNPRLARHRTTG